jgi:hypothetical protein
MKLIIYSHLMFTMTVSGAASAAGSGGASTPIAPPRVPAECKISNGANVSILPCLDFEVQTSSSANKDVVYGSACVFEQGAWKRGTISWDYTNNRQVFSVRTVCDKGITTMSPIVVTGPRLSALNLDNSGITKSGTNVTSTMPQGIPNPTICYTAANYSSGVYLPGAPVDCDSNSPCVFLSNVANPAAPLPPPIHQATPLILSGSFWIRKQTNTPDSPSHICVGGVRRD